LYIYTYIHIYNVKSLYSTYPTRNNAHGGEERPGASTTARKGVAACCSHNATACSAGPCALGKEEV
jgi:hypothetical protein